MQTVGSNVCGCGAETCRGQRAHAVNVAPPIHINRIQNLFVPNPLMGDHVVLKAQ